MDKGWMRLSGQQKPSCILEKPSLIHISGPIIILLKGQVRLDPRTRKEARRKLSYQLNGRLPFQECLLLSGQTHQEEFRRQACANRVERAAPHSEMPVHCWGQSLSSHQTCNIREEHPECHRHRGTLGRLGAKPCSLLC